MAGCVCEGSVGSQVARLCPDTQTVGSAPAPGNHCVPRVCFLTLSVHVCVTLCVSGRGSERRSCSGCVCVFQAEALSAAHILGVAALQVELHHCTQVCVRVQLTGSSVVALSVSQCLCEALICSTRAHMALCLRSDPHTPATRLKHTPDHTLTDL